MEITENELIKRLARFEKKGPHIIRGIGDDGAVAELEQGAYVFVQDAVVENIHFTFEFMDAFYVGKKAIYVNVSDVLSMGAVPLYYLVTVGIPGRLLYRDLRRLYQGMSRSAGEFGLFLAGGDTTATKGDFFVDVSMVGKVVTREYLGRNKARVGDLVAVTGVLGESAYGLQLLKDGIRPAARNRFVERYRNPKPPHRIWKELMKHDITTAMMDISDGLLIDLERMMVESSAGAEIYLESVPMPDTLRKKGKETLALSGGEDYQFLFTLPQEKVAALKGLISAGWSLSIIGQVVRKKGVRLFSQGRLIDAKAKGYQHFGASS
jgi:thiamine-monophosphate kinase